MVGFIGFRFDVLHVDTFITDLSPPFDNIPALEWLSKEVFGVGREDTIQFQLSWRKAPCPLIEIHSLCE